jgi:excinuclease ABC subunit C
VSDQLVETLEKRVACLPEAPGVYLLKNRKGTIIYAGKAKSLLSRVKSYFQHYSSSSAKLHSMVSQINDLDYIVTSTEKEALILEGTLIKQHRPRYNVVLKDDKNYPYLKLTLKEQFPRLSLVRKVEKDHSLYFGPFASARAVRETIKVIHQNFLLRKCQTTLFQFRQRPCLNYQIAQCPAPCCKMIDEEKYGEVVKEVELFLGGRGGELIEMLEGKMADASDRLDFELAAALRDRITSLRKTLEKQKAVVLDFTNRDVISFHLQNGDMTLVVLLVRNGKIIDRKDFTFRRMEVPVEEVISSFLNQFYREDKLVPQEILIPIALEDQSTIEDALRERRGGKVELFMPQRGEKAALVEMARLNAVSVFATAQGKVTHYDKVADELQQKLHLSAVPFSIECYDISNLGGHYAVGSMVYCRGGEPLKDNYRRFKIKTIEKADDCGMLYEVLKRRFSRGEEAMAFPDLVVVDGGKGQLNVAVRVLHELQIKTVEVVALAKGRTAGSRGARGKETPLEQIFLPRRKNPLLLPAQSPALLLLQRIRDEAHRFALAYHHKLRAKGDFHSVLDDIPGVGKIIRNRLLRHFGSIDKLKNASLDELRQVAQMNQKRAETLYNFFKSKKQC